MKKNPLFTISIVIFLTGIILKLLNLPLSGTLIAIGLIFFIVAVILRFGTKNKLSFRDILVIILSVAIAALIFSLVQNKVFVIILGSAVILSLVIYLSTILIKRKKE